MTKIKLYKFCPIRYNQSMKTHKYINEYFYFVVKHEGAEGADVLHICSGVNMDRFYPILKGRYGIGGNPINSGLNLVNLDFCAQAHENGATATIKSGVRIVYRPHETAEEAPVWIDCSGLAPTKEAWYTEQTRIDNASAIDDEALLRRGVMLMINKITSCTNLQLPAHVELPSPDEIQVYLDGLCLAMAS